MPILCCRQGSIKFHKIFKSPFKIHIDLYGRLWCGHPLLEHNKRPQTEFHGPAMHLIRDEGLDLGIVYALRCRCLPKDDIEWLSRKRPYEWPPHEVIKNVKR